MRATSLLALVVLVILAAPLAGQSLYGMEGQQGQVWEFTTAPGGPCPAPNPVMTPCNYVVPAPCPIPVPPPGLVGPPPDEFGDIAVDSRRDTYFVTDGFVIEEYQARGPCGLPPPCTPLNAFFVPLAIINPLTGMGMDEFGVHSGGVRTLWVTDGSNLAGFQPSAPGTCAPPTLVWGPSPLGIPAFAGDVTWDPITQSVWVCDYSGQITNVNVASGVCVPGVSFAPFVCGLGQTLTGIAYDLATPDATSPTGAPGALYVTDGFTVEYIDINGAKPVPTFYTPVVCTPTPAPLNGLAYNANAITYGNPTVAASLTSFGQSNSPGPTFGIEITGSPAGATPWLILRFNVHPAPNFFCPPITGLGVNFWVNPGAPSLLLALPPLPPTCTPINLAVPNGTPPGVQGYMQVVYTLPGGPPGAIDATNGLEFTIGSL